MGTQWQYAWVVGVKVRAYFRMQSEGSQSEQFVLESRQYFPEAKNPYESKKISNCQP